MKKIKFRVWDIEECVMYNQNDLIISYSHIGSDCYVNTKECVRPLHSYKVMQYIGLKDKDGKEIYEGDIVKFMDEETIYSDCGYEYNEFINTGKVIFNKELMGWDVTNRNMDLEEVWHYSEYIKVIGNIYENPNLNK